MVDTDDWLQEINPEYYPPKIIEGIRINRHLIIGPGDYNLRKLIRPSGSKKDQLVKILKLYQQNKCAVCQENFSQYVCPYELDHIVGIGCTKDSRANNIDNLQLLCSNCHTIKSKFCDPIIFTVMSNLGQVRISRALIQQEISCYERTPTT